MHKITNQQRSCQGKKKLINVDSENSLLILCLLDENPFYTNKLNTFGLKIFALYLE